LKARKTKMEMEDLSKTTLLQLLGLTICRYFGTPKLVEEYERTVSAHCKCTMEGVSKEFVSIRFLRDLKAKTLELIQDEYWDNAVIRFKEFLPSTGPKV
jgi:hypothetical protein